MVIISTSYVDLISPYYIVFIRPSSVDFHELLLYGFYLSYLC